MSASNECPRCAALMDDVTITDNVLRASCAICGWSGAKRAGFPGITITNPTQQKAPTTMTTTDNRWNPGASGASAPPDTPAAYAARWIDRGDDMPADVVPDRQGFDNSDQADIDMLGAMLTAEKANTLHHGTQQDNTTVTVLDGLIVVTRRSGGYVYVDAWLVPVPAVRTLDEVIESVRDWGLYRERHPDAWQGKETAIELLNELLAIWGQS